MEQTQTMHPEALKRYRKKRGLSQKALAVNCGCSAAQVSRWERGKIGRVRSRLQEGLTKALGVSWEQLTQAPAAKETELFPTVQLNVRVPAEVRTALWLVCLRYNVKPAELVELAPLLFLITAEKSLARRRQSLDAIWERIDRIEKDSPGDAPHLAPAFYRLTENEDARNALYDEQVSIDRRDVFCRRVQERYDVEQFDPYITYIKTLAADLPSGLIEEIEPSYLSGPTYTIAQDTLREVTGISGDNEEEQELLRLIWQGDIKLSDILSKKEDVSQEEYLHWLSEQRQTAKAEQEAKQKSYLKKLIADFGIDAREGGGE